MVSKACEGTSVGTDGSRVSWIGMHPHQDDVRDSGYLGNDDIMVLVWSLERSAGYMMTEVRYVVSIIVLRVLHPQPTSIKLAVISANPNNQWRKLPAPMCDHDEHIVFFLIIQVQNRLQTVELCTTCRAQNMSSPMTYSFKVPQAHACFGSSNPWIQVYLPATYVMKIAEFHYHYTWNLLEFTPEDLTLVAHTAWKGGKKEPPTLQTFLSR